MKKFIRTSISFLLLTTLLGCGGGGSDSGPKFTIPDLPDLSNIPTLPVGYEFRASECITIDPVKSALGILSDRTITNSCNRNVNYRDIKSSGFGPVLLIPANSKIKDGSSYLFGGQCFAPKVPGGVADIIDYQCLG